MKSKRLLAIADYVKENSLVADIGTDHGYIPVYLIEKGISKRLIGSDISKGSLEKIRSYVAARGLEDKIDIRLGNGLEVLRPFEVDTLIIAGMGGMLIRDILDKDWTLTSSINHFILQPMIGAKELRDYLSLNNFKIIDNRLLKEDNKYYEIIYAKKGKMAQQSEIDLELPMDMLEKSPDLAREYIAYKIAYAQSILDNIRAKDGDKVVERVDELKALIEAYKGVEREIENL